MRPIEILFIEVPKNMKKQIIDEDMKMFRTTQINMKIPLVFRPGTESLVTDQFK